jgi:hypothetical protein
MSGNSARTMNVIFTYHLNIHIHFSNLTLTCNERRRFSRVTSGAAAILKRAGLPPGLYIGMILEYSILSSVYIPHCFLGILPLSDFLVGSTVFVVFVSASGNWLLPGLLVTFSFSVMTSDSRFDSSSRSEWFVFSYTLMCLLMCVFPVDATKIRLAF